MVDKEEARVIVERADADPGQVGKLLYGICRLYRFHQLASSINDGDSKLSRGVRVKGEFWE